MNTARAAIRIDSATADGHRASFAANRLEKPLAADGPADEWRTLADGAKILFAAAVLGNDTSEAAMESGNLGVMRPDVVISDGIGGCLRIVRRGEHAVR